MTIDDDLMRVVDRTALIENILNQVIERFCQPRREPFMFFWNVVLDSSVMPLGAKVKVAMAISHEVKFKLDREALHSVIELRNAFAHHPLSSHPVFFNNKASGESEVRLELQVLRGNGKLTRMSRAEALKSFSEAFKAAKESLVALRDSIPQSASDA